MANELNLDGRRAEQEFEVELGEQVYRMRLYWRARLQGWYMDLLDITTGDPIALGRRLSPGFSPFAGMNISKQPTPPLIVLGVEPYTQLDLGTDRLFVLELEAEDVEDFDVSDDDTLHVEILP